MTQDLAASYSLNTSTQSQAGWISGVENIARCLALIALFFMPLSPAAGTLLIIASGMGLLTTAMRHQLSLIWRYKMNWILLAFIILLGLGVFRNPYSLMQGAVTFWKYLTYMIIIFFMLPLFTEKKWRRRAINTFIASSIFTIFIFYTQNFDIVHWNVIFQKPFDKIFPPIIYSMTVALACFVLLNRIIDENKFRVFYGLLFLLLFVLMFFLNQERTGVLVFLGLLVLLAFQRFGWKGFAGGIITVSLFFAAIYLLSPMVQKRFDAAIHETKTHTLDAQTSIGLRLTYIHHGLNIIKQHPLGQGTGLFIETGSNGDLEITPTLNGGRVNPENSYLHIALQIGIPGLILFLAWMGMQLYESRKLPYEDRYLVQGAVVTMIISSFCITAIYFSQSALLYTSFLAIFMAARFDPCRQA